MCRVEDANSVVSRPRKGEEASLRRVGVSGEVLFVLVFLEAARPLGHSVFQPWLLSVNIVHGAP